MRQRHTLDPTHMCTQHTLKRLPFALSSHASGPVPVCVRHPVVWWCPGLCLKPGPRPWLGGVGGALATRFDLNYNLDKFSVALEVEIEKTHAGQAVFQFDQQAGLASPHSPRPTPHAPSSILLAEQCSAPVSLLALWPMSPVSSIE